MQWNSQPNAGFTTGTPWIKVNDNYPVINVEAQRLDSDSIWHHYKKLIGLRRESDYQDIIVYGEYQLLHEEHPMVYAYTRSLEGRTLLVVSNFFAKETIVCLKGLDANKVILSNYQDSSLALECLTLRPFESIVYALN